VDKKSIIALIGILVLSSCAIDKTGFIIRHKKKNITLTTISDQIKIGYETDSAVIYIGQNDAIKQTEKLLSNKKLNARFDYRLIADFKSSLDSLKRINKNILIKHWLNQKVSIDIRSYDFAGFMDQWILKVLILKGKTEIWNKTSKKYEKRITYHYIKDQLGGESCYFTFENGNEFHHQLILLGE
jgi:hypothetical protein